MTPDELRDEARRLRERAADLDDDNPPAAEYHRRRADWSEYLARSGDDDADGGRD